MSRHGGYAVNWELTLSTGGRQRGVLHVDGVELSIVSVIRIELKTDKSAREEVIDSKLVKYSRMPFEAFKANLATYTPETMPVV